MTTALNEERARFLGTLQESCDAEKAWTEAAAAWERTLEAARDLNKTLADVTERISKVGQPSV